MLKDATIERLVDAARRGDHEAYSELVTRFEAHILATIYNVVNDEDLAQDLTQDTFIQAHKKLRKLREPHLFAGWLRRIARNICVDHQRRNSRRGGEVKMDLDHTHVMELEDHMPSPSESVERWEMARVLLRAISRLPEKYRTPLIRAHLDGHTYQRIADELDMPLGTIKTLIRTGKEKLRPILQSVEDTTNMVAAAPSPKLIILSDQHRGRVIDLTEDEIIIGRHPDCDLQINDPTLSVQHCRLRRESDGEYWIEDLDSTNGTWLNSIGVVAHPLTNSDVIQVGYIEIVYDRTDKPLTSVLSTQTGFDIGQAVIEELDDSDGLSQFRRTASLGKVVITNGRPQFVS